MRYTGADNASPMWQVLNDNAAPHNLTAAIKSPGRQSVRARIFEESREGWDQA